MDAMRIKFTVLPTDLIQNNSFEVKQSRYTNSNKVLFYILLRDHIHERR